MTIFENLRLHIRMILITIPGLVQGTSLPNLLKSFAHLNQPKCLLIV
jgi:hypothetical protein